MIMHTPYKNQGHPVGSGTQKLYRFQNGYGASVVQFMIGSFEGSYGAENGLWELAVVVFESPDSERFKLSYETPITDDVLGRLTEYEVENVLNQIEALPTKTDAFLGAIERERKTKESLKEFMAQNKTP